MKNRRMVFLAFLVILSLGCVLFGSNNGDEAAVVDEATPVEAVQEPTLPPPTAMPPTEIPATNVPPTLAPPPLPSWRMAPPDGSFLVVQDSDKDPQWEEIANAISRRVEEAIYMKRTPQKAAEALKKDIEKIVR